MFTRHIHEEIHLSLVEKSDTSIVLKESTVYVNITWFRGYEFWVKWEVLTDDVRSEKVVVR